MNLNVTASSSKRQFEFGKNWRRFLALVDDRRIAQAEMSLKEMLAREDLVGKRFLDIGCGSGLFSLAARRLGAQVHSFDCDLQSVACTAELRRRYHPQDRSWRIEEGSVLNERYLRMLGQFDVVYAWGVLHHTGAMWQALENVAPLVAPGGKLFLSIYNDQGRASKFWLRVKRIYNRVPKMLRWIIPWAAMLRLWGPTMLRDLFRGKPFATWRRYSSPRGMSPWRDVVDWVGGYPFEVAKPEAIFDFYRERGFMLQRLKTCGGGRGCNEFVLVKTSA